MKTKRPDLTNVEPEIRLYIEALEQVLQKHVDLRGSANEINSQTPPAKPNEPPTTLQLITLTASAKAKRTSRHFYLRQRRGGMGVFDLDTPEDDPPKIIVVADETQHLLLFSNLARAFRIPVNIIATGEIRDKGQSLTSRIQLQPGERLVAALTDQAKGGVALLSNRGMVRYLRHHVFGEYMRPGMVMFDTRHFGELITACRTSGESDLLIATRKGKAIRFSEKLIPPQGGSGIRLEEHDEAMGITAVHQDSNVLFVDSIGRGTIRPMQSFSPNKSAGGGGKLAMNTEQLIWATTVEEDDDIFMISGLGKIIRFMAAEIPAKEGVVQGVNCMALRADEVQAVTVTA